MPKGPIVSCVAGRREAVAVFEGVVRLRERYRMKEELEPVISLREVEGRGILRRASALITDLRSPVKAGLARCPAERVVLARILAAYPSLPVVVVAEAREAARVGTDPDLPIREVVLRGEEDDPASLALMLVRLRARHPEREVLERLPRGLPSTYHLGLARAYRPSKRIPGEKELVEWSGRDLRVARRDFRRAGLRPMSECATLMRLVAALEAIHQGGRDVDEAAGRFGFTDRPTLHQAVRTLTNTPPPDP